MEGYLSIISYYRFRAYTYPFQDNVNPEMDHHFIRNNIRFSDIIKLYYFDKKLRNLLFKALGEIEVALRAKIIQVFSEYYGNSHWFSDNSIFNRKEIYSDEKRGISSYENLAFDIRNEINRSNEDFIIHYKDKYGDPELPPAWMTLEALSFGTLSRLYKLLLASKQKEKVANDFGLPNNIILVNWMHAFSALRNSCAHHSRIWNRRFIVHLKLPYNTTYNFMDKQSIKKTTDNKVFALLSCIKYLIHRINPTYDIKKELFAMLQEGGELFSLRDMGFPEKWESLPIWMD